MEIVDHFRKLLSRKRPEDIRREQLKRDYNELLGRLSDIRANYDLVDDVSAADALIYEENAALKLLGRLFAEARKEGLTLEYHENKKT